MGEKLRSISNMNVPGAGTYEPKDDQTSPRKPQFSMGVRLRSEFASKVKVPGPGSYTNRAEKLR